MKPRKKGGTTSVKRLARAEESGGTAEETRSNKERCSLDLHSNNQTHTALARKSNFSQLRLAQKQTHLFRTDMLPMFSSGSKAI